MPVTQKDNITCSVSNLLGTADNSVEQNCRSKPHSLKLP